MTKAPDPSQAPTTPVEGPRRPWRGRQVLLGVSGGIAAYKSVLLARDLTQLGALVDVVLTRSAGEFVGPVTFEAVTGRPVHTQLIAPGAALDHIRLARAAEVVCVAPATADLLARAAAGRSDDLLAAVLLATRAPVLLCPAMNDRMWAHAQTQANVTHLRELGYHIIGPATGPLAFGEGEGPGRMEEPQAILEHIGRALEREGGLRGRKIVVTAGPTREPVDPVRVLSNRSSGRMGYALAAAAWRRGADVDLITGPTELTAPTGPAVKRIETAEQMLDAVTHAIKNADALIMAAAVADFRPAAPTTSKIKKSARLDALELERAPDVLAATRSSRPAHLRVVGFALETDDGLDNARRKLEEKALDLIVLNDPREPGAGFEVDTNRVTILSRDGQEHALPLLSKHEVADAILDQLIPLLPANR
ncbi:MAG TPA: bifunctional phosphopantothenoylcysteine decarboxylase/phosphopantothenate--cysteine ligase CoaBC [Longimicrobiales bacterium]|nr:bifunctional phosphopantothenoylcysteine decarboxylase/phosphopantothenate--cysteine ligase CoaBC [Longimicrobiales bacterium]